MTDPNASPAPVPVEKAGLFEDFIDIFGSPAKVFVRRTNSNPMVPYLIVCIVLIGLFFAMKNAMGPIYDTIIQKAVDAAAKANPSLTQDQLNQSRGFIGMSISIGAVIVVPCALLMLGLLGWIVAKVFGGTITYSNALMVASFAYVPRVVGAIATMIQSLVMDMSKLTSVHQLELSPGRFMDPATASPILLAFYSRIDVTILWETFLLAMGIAIVAKLPRSKVLAIAITFWVIGMLPALYGGWKEAQAMPAAATVAPAGQ